MGAHSCRTAEDGVQIPVGPMETILVVVILIYSIILHEIAHGYVAYKLGDPTAKYSGRLTLNPIPHIDPIGTIFLPILGYLFTGFIFGWAKPVPYNPYNLRNPQRDSILIAVSGPLTNILLVLFFTSLSKTPLFLSFQEPIIFGLRINLILAFFNLLPIPPLDGSKLLLLKLPFEVYQILEMYGFLFIFLFIYFIYVLFPQMFSIVDYLQNFLLNI